MTKSYERPEKLHENFDCENFIRDEDKVLLTRLLKTHKLSADEYERIKKILGRAPTFTELGVFSSMWSEHCSYKSSRVHLSRFPTKGKHVVQGPGENAGIVRLHGELGIAFKMESHNHPSFIEPYQGAATGVGGILRDVFCMGARPIAMLNALRFGKRALVKTSYLVEHAVRGIGDYGNCMGIPTVGGNISFDQTYDGNCLVNAMCVGLIREKEIFRGHASGKGNLVVYVGSSTGRDGIHGATMASDSFASQTHEDRSAVQVGDPFTQKLLMEATLSALANGLVVGLQDMGAAGLTSSSYEMASRGESGTFLNLDLIPRRAAGMSAYEIMLSESQERMLMVVSPSAWPKLKEIFERWQLSHAIVGSVTETKRVEAVFEGKLVIDTPVAPITDEAPKYTRAMSESGVSRSKKHADKETRSLSSLVEKRIKDLSDSQLFEKVWQETAHPHDVYRQYDRHIGRRTYFDSSHGGAALLWIREKETLQSHPFLGVAIATASCEHHGAVTAFHGGAMSVVKACRGLFALGARPLGTTDCLNFGNPEDPLVMREFSDAVDGISKACQAFDAPVVSGNVSLYNETDGQSILPTPMIGVVGRVEDVRLARPATFSSENTGMVVALLTSRAQLEQISSSGGYHGASLLARIVCRDELLHQASSKDLAPIDYTLELLVADAIKTISPLARAIRDVGTNGLAVTIASMCSSDKGGSKFGFCVEKDGGVPDSGLCESRLAWYSEWAASYITGFLHEGSDFSEAQKLIHQNFNGDLMLIKLGVADPNVKSLRFEFSERKG